VQHLIHCREHRQVRSGVEPASHDLDAIVDDDLAVLVVRRRMIDGRIVSSRPNGLSVSSLVLGDLTGQVGRRRLRQRGDETEPAALATAATSSARRTTAYRPERTGCSTPNTSVNFV